MWDIEVVWREDKRIIESMERVEYKALCVIDQSRVAQIFTSSSIGSTYSCP